MSILLAGLDAELSVAVTRRLVAQGDQVRMIAAAGAAAPPGAHVAVGAPGDEDRVAALVAAARAGVDRAVLLERGLEEIPPAMSWVVLLLPARRLLARKTRLEPDLVAEAVDAADDLAGEPRLTADLGAADGWRALRLEPPAGR